MKNIEDLLEYQRKKLLDTSRRTPLLNYRLTSKAIEIESDWPQDIFHHLVNRQKSLVFLAKIEDEEEDLDKLQLYVEDSSDEDDLDLDFSELDDELQLNEFRVDTPHPELVTGEVEHEEETSRFTALKNTLQDTYRRLISRGKLLTTHEADDLKKRIVSIYKDIRRFNRELAVCRRSPMLHR